MHHLNMNCHTKMLVDVVYDKGSQWTLHMVEVFDSTAYLKFAKLQCFLWLSLPGDNRVTDEALLAETT